MVPILAAKRAAKPIPSMPPPTKNFSLGAVIAIALRPEKIRKCRSCEIFALYCRWGGGGGVEMSSLHRFVQI